MRQFRFSNERYCIHEGLPGCASTTSIFEPGTARALQPDGTTQQQNSGRVAPDINASEQKQCYVEILQKLEIRWRGVHISEEASKRVAREATRLEDIENMKRHRRWRGVRIPEEASTCAAREAARLEDIEKMKHAHRLHRQERRTAQEGIAHLAAEETARMRFAETVEAEQERRRTHTREYAAELAAIAEEEAIFTTQHMLGSTLVTCGAGLEVRGVVCGLNSCQITIKNLPLDATNKEVVELFTQQGISRDCVHVLSIEQVGDDHLEATVITSADNGATIAIGLNGIQFRSERLEFIISKNIPLDSMAEATHTITISWTAPSMAAAAQYSSMDDAHAKACALDRAIFGGRRIRAELRQPPNGPELRFYDPASVELTRLPPGISTDTIAKWAGAISVHIIRQQIYDIQRFIQDLRQRLASLPNCKMQSFETVQGVTDIPLAVDDIVRVKVRFGSWHEADNARVALEGTPSLKSDYPPLRVSLPIRQDSAISLPDNRLRHFESTIPVQQYTSQRRLWASLTDMAHTGISIQINPVPHRTVVRVQLSGHDKKALGALKVQVEGLIAGEKLNPAFWDGVFLTPKGANILAKVFSRTGAYIRVDLNTQTLRIYGEREASKKACTMLENEMIQISQEEMATVQLETELISYFIHAGGPAALLEVFGEDVVPLDLASPSQCKITVRGGTSTSYTLGMLIDQARQNWKLRAMQTGNNDICPICYNTVSLPVTLRCEHVYCIACIRHYLTSAAVTKIFPLVCIGDEAKCKEAIPIPLIRRFLIPQQYEHLVSVAFSAYLDRNPMQYKHCPTPGCTQMYHANTKAVLKCPSCLAEVCSLCHEEAHEGVRCGEHRERRRQEVDEKLTNEWATANGAKRCPDCRVYIEKISGCNHMTCRCGAHLCWICLKKFPANRIYSHLRTHPGANGDLDHAANLQDELNGGQGPGQAGCGCVIM